MSALIGVVGNRVGKVRVGGVVGLQEVAGLGLPWLEGHAPGSAPVTEDVDDPDHIKTGGPVSDFPAEQVLLLAGIHKSDGHCLLVLALDGCPDANCVAREQTLRGFSLAAADASHPELSETIALVEGSLCVVTGAWEDGPVGHERVTEDDLPGRIQTFISDGALREKSTIANKAAFHLNDGVHDDGLVLNFVEADESLHSSGRVCCRDGSSAFGDPTERCRAIAVGLGR